MKKVLIVIAVLALAASTYAFDLVCDPQTGVKFYDVEINGTVVDQDYPAQTDGSIKWSVDILNPGTYTFRVKCKDVAGGWASDWSNPFVSKKPVKAGNLKIK